MTLETPVPPDHTVEYLELPPDQIVLATYRGLHHPAIVKYIEAMVAADTSKGQSINCPVGEFLPDGRFSVTHGRHRCMAAVILGFDPVLLRRVVPKT